MGRQGRQGVVRKRRDVISRSRRTRERRSLSSGGRTGCDAWPAFGRRLRTWRGYHEARLREIAASDRAGCRTDSTARSVLHSTSL